MIGWQSVVHLLVTVATFSTTAAAAAQAQAQATDRPPPPEVARALERAGANRPELESALAQTPEARRAGMEFLVAHMPEADLQTLKAPFLLENLDLAYQAREQTPWGPSIPEELFLNNVLPYANVDEQRDPWRKHFYDLCMPIARQCKTPTEAVGRLNAELFKTLNVKYSTARRAANQSPSQSIEQGLASCTGLSIILSDACRAVGIPARLVGTPMWTNKRGNHTWVEIWDDGWHFTGACEPDPNGLDRGWFIDDASHALEDSPEHAIYAASWKQNGQHFPLVWDLRNESVGAENVTSRYARKPGEAEATTVRVLVRVTGPNGKRVAERVVVLSADKAQVAEGLSRDEGADTNDILAFRLAPDSAFEVHMGDQVQPLHTGAAGGQMTLDLHQSDAGEESNHTTDDQAASHQALQSLRAALDEAKPAPLADLASQPFARVPLTKSDAADARRLLWDAHAQHIRAERAAEVEARTLHDGDLAMPFAFTTFGDQPAGGRSLWISLHGGGNAPARVNDRQWENQKKLYSLDEGLYLAPRAPTNTWNLWHEPHIDRLFDRLVEDLIVLENVDPNRVYVLGYSAGGDGVYQLAPRLADHWAAAAMMAGHPNGVSLLSLRNVPFALQVGANDAAYNRNEVGREYGAKLDALQAADPNGYNHFVRIRDGKPHWMDGDDKEALPWMAALSRNPIPDRVVWKQTGSTRDRSYWLAVPPGEARPDSLVVARRDGQTIDITEADGVATLLVRLDDRMLDLDHPVTIRHGDTVLFEGVAPRTIANLVTTLAGRGDPGLVFDAEVPVTGF
jgi:hypothetical protein